MSRIINVERPGAPKPNPFTICVIANPFIERPLDSNNYVRDPILSDHQKFRDVLDYAIKCLFGQLPQQREVFLSNADIEPHVKIVSVFDDTVSVNDGGGLVGEQGELVRPISRAFIPFLNRYGLKPDIVFAVTDSDMSQRSSASYATDGDDAPGVPFNLDGVVRCHVYESRTPGTVALHTSARSLVALHEFCHAISSWENGKIVDLYGNLAPACNSKLGQIPNPPHFANYNNIVFLPDTARLPNRSTVQGFFCCELTGAKYPALMDNFWLEPSGVYEHCEHDKITREFLRDRILAKINRP